MDVADLIKQLKSYPKEAQVYVRGSHKVMIQVSDYSSFPSAFSFRRVPRKINLTSED